MKSWNLVLPSPSTQVETAWNDICPTLEVEENTVAYANRKKSCAVFCRILKKYLRARIGFPVFLPPPLFYLKFPGISIPRGEERRRKRASSLPRRLPGPRRQSEESTAYTLVGARAGLTVRRRCWISTFPRISFLKIAMRKRGPTSLGLPLDYVIVYAG